MKRTPLLLHVGTHKTGTTAIQHTLAADRDRLRQAGIVYPDPRSVFRRSANGRAHHIFASAVADGTFKSDYRAWRFVRRATAESRDARIVVLSTEAIYRMTLTRDVPLSDTDWFAGHDLYMARLARRLRPFDIRVMIYFRDPFSFGESLFKESAAKQAVPEITFDTWIARSACLFKYDIALEGLRRQFADVEVRRYEDEARDDGSGRDLVGRFYVRLGIEAPKERPPRMRESMSNPAAAWLMSTPPAATKDAYNGRLQYAMEDPDGVFTEQHRTTLWSRDAARAFAERHANAFGLTVNKNADLPDRPTCRWTEEDSARADRAASAWIAANLDLLKRRQDLRLKFYQSLLE